MKEKLRKEKGITLIALIITIIILLILAMVSVSILINNGIITKTKEGVDKYKEEERKEMSSLNNFADYLNQITGGGSGEWIEPTAEEFAEFQYNPYSEYTIAEGQNSRMFLIDMSYGSNTITDLYAIFIVIEKDSGVEVYAMLSNKSLYDYYSNSDEYSFDDNRIATLTPGKWYKTDDDGNPLSDVPYTGNSPIKKSDFSNIYSDSYLERVIASFN